ncbi:MAG: cyclic nucleotide-binding domain-containing protein [Persicimonas sp.]
MTSKKLKKYLAYYQKTLREEPDNIEARLRLASIFRDMGREVHAVEEYVTASKLLAREGLPLEAIAACKAVLELEPHHTETQLFLARMYARAPDAAGGTARIARPVESEPGAKRRVPVDTPHAPHQTSPQQAASKKDAPEPLTLSHPKQSQPSSSTDDKQTAVSSSGLIGLDDDEPTAVVRPRPEDIFDEEDERTRQADASDLPDLESMRLEDEREETLLLGSIDRNDGPQAHRDEADDQIRATAEMDASDRESVLRSMAGSGSAEEQKDLRTTVDVDDDDILSEEEVDASPSVGGEDAQRMRGTSQLGEVMPGRRRDRPETSRGLPSVSAGPDTAEFEAEPPGEDDWEETFEVGVFDMDSLRLDRESSGNWDDLSFLDELEEPDTAELVSVSGLSPESSMLSVSRADLPDIPLFSQLEPAVFMQLLRIMDFEQVDAGTAIVEPGRSARSLYIIVRGTTVVTRDLDDGTVLELAEMGEGEFFGEFALLTGRSQMATVRAQTDVALLEASAAVIDRVAQEHPEIWNVLWDFYHARMLNNMLASSTIFRSLSDRQRHELAELFTLEEVPSGELVAGEGEHDHDLYLICSGEVRVEREVGGGIPREIDTLREGEFVGLISSVEEEPVVANLRATRDTTLLVLAGREFRRVIGQDPMIERRVREVVRERKAAAGQYTSGVTSYAELGLAPPRADVSDTDERD